MRPATPHLGRASGPAAARAPHAGERLVSECPAVLVEPRGREVRQVQDHLVTAGAGQGGEVATFQRNTSSYWWIPSMAFTSSVRIRSTAMF